MNYGVHILADFYDCDKEACKFVKPVKEAMFQAARKAKINEVSHSFYQFQPQSVSGAILIKESHLSVHTWTESCFAAIDVYTCGKRSRPDVAIAILKEYFKPKRVVEKRLYRGEM